MNFLSRAPFTWLGAIGLLSLGQDLLVLHEWFAGWIDRWQAVTRPIWDLLIGWLFDWIGWKLQWWVKDYLTMGLIVAGMMFRALTSRNEWTITKNIEKVSRHWVIWPLTIIAMTASHLEKDFADHKGKKATVIFWETFIWAMVIISVNYALLFYAWMFTR